MLSGSSAFAYSYTNIQAPSGAELDQREILDLIYGGTFVQAGENYSNGGGGISLIRVWDNDDPTTDPVLLPLDIVTGKTAFDIDQIWTDGVATVTAEAKYAALNQSFGWNGGGIVGAGYIELLTDGDIGGAGVVVDVAGDVLWGVNPSSGDIFWSRDNQNADGEDHLITFQVLGLGGVESVWLQFWEDLPLAGSDQDYNDFVIEIRAVPEPGTGVMMAIGISILAGTRRRRS